MQPIYITGIGVISPVGNSRQEFWDSLCQGRSGIRPLESIEVGDLPISIGGEVRNLDPREAEINDKVTAKRMDRATLYAVLAAKEAIADAGLTHEHLCRRCAVVVGSGLAGIAVLQEQTENLLRRGARGVSPLTIPLLMPNAPVANISLAFDIVDTAYNVASACSSSGHAMIDAFELLQRGEVDVVVTGGTEAAMTRLAIAAFANMKAMTRKYNERPAEASRPFDADRDGFIMSEGSAILVFETEAHLKRRGGRAPYARMAGYGATMDAFHLVQPDPSGQGAVRAIARALAHSQWTAGDIAGHAYVNAHGTSTKYNDAAETAALKEVFGAAAAKLQISSTKSVTGHLIGAACSLEMAAAALALHHQKLPPTINYQTPDPECDLDYVPNQARPASVRYALNNSFGFGGHNVCVTLEKV